MSRDKGYGGTRRGDTALAGKMLFSPGGVTDDELAEILDFDIDGEPAVLWCRRQDARRFKREKCAQAGALVFSVRADGEEKPRYLGLPNIPPEEMRKLRRRAVKSIARAAGVLAEIELNDKWRLGLSPVEDEVLEVVREVLSAAMVGRRLKSA